MVGEAVQSLGEMRRVRVVFQILLEGGITVLSDLWVGGLYRIWWCVCTCMDDLVTCEAYLCGQGSPW